MMVERLKLQPQTELHNPRTAAAKPRIPLRHVRGLRDQPKRGRPKRSLGKSEVGMVEQVEELGPELQKHWFPDREVLGRGKIQIAVAGTIDSVAPQIPKRIIRGLAEGIWIQISARRGPIGENGIHACDHIRTLVKIESPTRIIRVDDRNGTPGLNRNDGIQLPTGPQKMRQVRQGRNAVSNGRSPSLACVESRRAFFR